ncbi:MAG: class I SAM-dependent methyltransferase [Spirochaetaceae bacterium]|nr:MAG: class I SAM-dependent methyltransferase [Spirochaetaceae bacterium]
MSEAVVQTDRATVGLIRAAFSLGNYHQIMNDLYEEVFGEPQMVHFPYYGSPTDTLLDGQANLTDACLEFFPDLSDQRLLEVGCGNGVQSMYVLANHRPRHVTGMDLNPNNVALAGRIAADKGLSNIDFIASDAQDMQGIPDGAFDAVLNVESAFHYPDKPAFLNEVHRVLKPGGRFVMADLLMKPNRRSPLLRMWERRLSQHYWFADSYRTAFADAGLKIDAERDITAPVLRGFRERSAWFRNHKIRGALRRAHIMLFVRAQVFRHVYYLQNICSYHIFSAVKAG